MCFQDYYYYDTETNLSGLISKDYKMMIRLSLSRMVEATRVTLCKEMSWYGGWMPAVMVLTWLQLVMFQVHTEVTWKCDRRRWKDMWSEWWAWTLMVNTGVIVSQLRHKAMYNGAD